MIYATHRSFLVLGCGILSCNSCLSSSMRFHGITKNFKKYIIFCNRFIKDTDSLVVRIIYFSNINSKMIQEDINVDKAILSLIGKLQKYPLLVYSEADLQTLLSIELSAHDKVIPTKNGLETCRVHREVPYTKIKTEKKSHNTDIVIFTRQDIESINANLGWLYVKGQFSDGSRERRGKNKEVKRATFCSHLIELKTPPRETIKYTTLNPKVQKRTIEHDFNALRNGYRDYIFFMKEYGIETQLYFFCYVVWEARDNTTKKNQVLEFKQGFEHALAKPEVNEPEIKFYLLIGPKNEWEDYFLADSSLHSYLDKQIFFF